MELTIPHSSLGVQVIVSQCCKASSHENRLIPINPTTKNIKSSKFPSKCSTNKLILPIGLYWEGRLSKSFFLGQHKQKSARACAQVESDDSNSILAKAQVTSFDINSVRDEVLCFASGCYKFLRPYGLRQAAIGNTCLFARILVENPQLFKWSLLFNAFPGLIAVMLAFAYCNGLNQIFDVAIDRVNKPYLPLPTGELSLKQAWFLVMFDVVVGLSILHSMNANLITISLYCLGLLLGTFYSAPPFRFKGSSVATLLVIPLICGIIQNVGVLYAIRTSLGLSFWWSPSIIFITTFAALMFVAICLVKDLTDVEGDMKHNIVTFTAVFGPKNIVFCSTGLLLMTYIGAITASVCMPQVFKPYIMVPAHAMLSLLLLIETKKLGKTNYSKEESANFFQFHWKLLSLEFLLFPFI